MGTYKEESQEEQQEAHQDPTIAVEENLITGPPASRTVIDNLKKLLVQRQCSRESDYENKNRVTQSTSGSNSDAAFYSQFSTSSSDSDSESDSNFIFEDISNQENRKGTGRRRPHRRQRSYSSSSSSSRSPVEKRRRKPVSKIKPALAGSDDNARQFPPEPSKGSLCNASNTSTPTGGSHQEVDSANSTSSHKDSSTEDENNSVQRLNDGEAGGGSKLLKLQSRRDRNRKRKRSQTNYANHGPNNAPGYQLIPKIVISPSDNDVHSVETERNTNSNNIPLSYTSSKITNHYAAPELSAGTDKQPENKTGEISGEKHNDNNIK